MKLSLRIGTLVPVLLILGLGASVRPASAKVDVVAATTDLGDIAREVGGDKVSVVTLAKPTENYHYVEPRPSMVNSLRKADVMLRIGMKLDLWMDGLINAARNGKIAPGGTGYVDCSAGIPKLEVPSGSIDMRQGDVHPDGNPHYWLDPLNGKIIANGVFSALAKASPGDKAYFDANRDTFNARIDAGMARWKKTLSDERGVKVVTYHRSWSYFTHRFGLKVVDELEPKPGIAPSASHVNDVINTLKSNGAKVIIVEPFFPLKYPRLVAKTTGAHVVVVGQSVGFVKEVGSYIELFDYLVAQVDKAA